MHQMVSANLDASRRWWVLAIVVAAQFMFGVDAFVVNVALPTIAAELHASAAQVESVIAIYLIAYATLVVTGGRLGDIYGTRNVFVAGVAGFTVTSLWCGLAQSGPELIVARLAQILADHHLNIDSLLQKPGFDKNSLPFVITLEPCRDSMLHPALEKMAGLEFMLRPCLCLPILQ